MTETDVKDVQLTIAGEKCEEPYDAAYLGTPEAQIIKENEK